MNAVSSNLAYETFEAEAHIRVDTLYYKLKSNLKYMKGKVTREMLPDSHSLAPKPNTVYSKLNNALAKIVV